MKTILKYLIPAALALAACTKEQNTVDPDPAPVVSEPEAYFVEGLVSAKASNPETRTWVYTNEASGNNVLKFEWSDLAKAQDGTARFEGFWTDADGYWQHEESGVTKMNTILNDAAHPTYVAVEDGNTNLHVSLPPAAANATKLLVFYTGKNINHTYVVDDYEPTLPVLSNGGKTISFEFDGQTKESYYVAGLEMNDVLYSVTDLSSESLTPDGGQPSATVNFSFRHLGTVFRIRIKNDSNKPFSLGSVYVNARIKKGRNDEEKPFATKLMLHYNGSVFSRSLSWVSTDYYQATPVASLPETGNPKGGGSQAPQYVVLNKGDIYTVYMTPMANPFCKLSDWEFDFSVYAHNSTGIETRVGKVTVDGDLMTTTSQSLESGYVYTVGVKSESPLFAKDGLLYMKDDEGNVSIAGLDEEYPSSTSITVPASVTDGEITYPVISVMDGAFAGQTGVTSIDLSALPSDIIIGGRTFQGCTALESVVLPPVVSDISTQQMFSGCTSLESITFPTSGMSFLGQGMFENCSSLEELTLPKITSADNPDEMAEGGGVFQGCVSLTSISVEEGSALVVDTDQNGNACAVYVDGGSWKRLVWIRESLQGSYTIADRTTAINRLATNSLSLSALEIPASVRAIEMDNFLHLPNMTTLTVNWTDPQTPIWAGWSGSDFEEDEWLAVFEEDYGETLEEAFQRRFFANGGQSGFTVYVPVGSMTSYESSKPWTFWNLTFAEQQQ